MPKFNGTRVGNRFGGEPVEQRQANLSDLLTPRDVFDTKTGAPAYVRANVGAAPYQDRLRNLQRFYPQAQRYGDNNFVYPDPLTGQLTMYNPPGLDVGDFASIGREISQTVGGIGGGILGAGASTPTAITSAPLMVPVGAALGSQAAGQAYDIGMRYLNGVIDTRSAPQRVAEAAAEIGTEAVLTKLGAEVPALARTGLNTVKNRFTGTGAASVADDFSAIGARPSAGTVSGDRAIQTIENSVAQTAGGAGVIQRSDDEMLNAMQRYAGQTAQSFGPVKTTQGVGEVLREGVEGAIGRFTNRANQLFDRVARMIPENVRAVPRATIDYARARTMEPVARELPKTSETVQNPKVSGILKAFMDDIAEGDGTVSYQAMKSLRTRLGKMLGDPMGYPDFDRAELKRLYSAVSQDMDDIAGLAGDKAQKAHNVASRYYRYNLERNIEVIDKIVSKKWDEQAAALALSGTKDGGSKLAVLRRNMEPEEWDAVAASVLNDMGMATPGQQGATGDLFSPATFLSNYNKMSPEAKTALFGGSRYKGLRPALDILVRTSAAVKDTAATRGYSNTARILGVMGLLGAGGTLITGDVTGGAATIAGSVIAPRAAAKLLTNERFVSWLANTAKYAPADYKGWGARVGQLTAIAKAEPAIREEIYQYFSALREAGIAPDPQR